MQKETIIYYLTEYNWEKGTLIRTSDKTCTIRNFRGDSIRIKKEKCAFEDEQVCVVWETWRGVNGRGSYRVERERYPNERIPASEIERQDVSGRGRVTEYVK